MENKENSRVRSRKSRSPQLTRKTAGNSSLIQSRCSGNGAIPNENPKKTGSNALKITKYREANVKSAFSPKTEEKNGNLFRYAITKRPSTASGSFRKKSDFHEKEQNRNPPVSRSFFMPTKSFEIDHEPIKNTELVLSLSQIKDEKDGLNNLKKKASLKVNCPINVTEDFEFTSLLSLAIYEQKKIIEMLCAATKNLQKNAVDEKMLKADVAGDNESLFLAPFFLKSNSEDPSSSCSFMNSFRSILEEIFQAWMCLFHFIINLTQNLCFEGTKGFSRNPKIEGEIVIQAIECVKLFSKLKMKSITDSLEELQIRNGQHVNEPQITDFEDKVLFPFLFEMNFIQKKATEILKNADKEKINEIS